MAKDPYPSETADRFIVRFPEGMRDRLKAEAAANARSMNSEIIARLASTFERIVSDDDDLPERFGNGDVLPVILDADGMPMSWDVLMMHIGHLMVNAGVQPTRVDVAVINPGEPAEATLKAYFETAAKYQKKLAKPDTPSSD